MGDKAMELVPVVWDNAAQRETVLTRGAMWCPPKLVTLVIGKNFTPQQAYMTLFPVIRDRGLLFGCKYLINFLQLGCMISVAGNPLFVAYPTMGVNVTIDSAL